MHTLFIPLLVYKHHLLLVRRTVYLLICYVITLVTLVLYLGVMVNYSVLVS